MADPHGMQWTPRSHLKDHADANHSQVYLAAMLALRQSAPTEGCLPPLVQLQVSLARNLFPGALSCQLNSQKRSLLTNRAHLAKAAELQEMEDQNVVLQGIYKFRKLQQLIGLTLPIFPNIARASLGVPYPVQSLQPRAVLFPDAYHSSILSQAQHTMISSDMDNILESWKANESGGSVL
jgi:hypothetical protein